jgi:hypothetical protein
MVFFLAFTSQEPLFNHSDTLSYGAERTGTVYLRLSDLSSLLPNQLASQYRPAGQAIDSIHQLFLIYTLVAAAKFVVSEPRGEREQRE